MASSSLFPFFFLSSFLSFFFLLALSRNSRLILDWIHKLFGYLQVMLQTITYTISIEVVVTEVVVTYIIVFGFGIVTGNYKKFLY